MSEKEQTGRLHAAVRPSPESLPAPVIRRARPEDRGALFAFYETFEPKGACLGLPPREDPNPWLLRLAPFSNFLVELEGKLVAHGALCNENGSGEVVVFVHQDYRGCGLGKLLLSELVAEARRLGLKRVWGMTELENVPMLRLARSLGFVPGEDPQEFCLLL